MTVFFPKKCELALQALLFLSTGEQGKIFTAFEISQQLEIPKEFVAKILQGLTDENIVFSKKGKNGGFALGRQAKDITLIQIVEAIDGLEVFNNCILGFKECSVQDPCPVHIKWNKLRVEAFKMLSEQNLSELKEQSLSKILSLKKST